MTQMMRALVKREAAKGIWMEEVPVPAPGPNEVLIKLEKTAICGTDLHIYLWDEWSQRTIKPGLVIGVFNYEHLYIGGGNASRIRFKLPPRVSIVPNEEGMRGAAYVWNPIGKKSRRPAEGAKKKVSASRKPPGRSSRPGKARRPKA